jgi:hypothetical protein
VVCGDGLICINHSCELNVFASCTQNYIQCGADKSCFNNKCLDENILRSNGEKFIFKPANFGTPIQPGITLESIIQGHAITVIPEDGCSQITNNVQNKFAIIQYTGTCKDIFLKSLNAQNAGAIGAFIINYTKSPAKSTTLINIPVLSLPNDKILQKNNSLFTIGNIQQLSSSTQIPTGSTTNVPTGGPTNVPTSVPTVCELSEDFFSNVHNSFTVINNYTIYKSKGNSLKSAYGDKIYKNGDEFEIEILGNKNSWIMIGISNENNTSNAPFIFPSYSYMISGKGILYRSDGNSGYERTPIDPDFFLLKGSLIKVSIKYPNVIFTYNNKSKTIPNINTQQKYKLAVSSIKNRGFALNFFY